MGKYDVLDKEYFSQPCHLAELITNGVYHGRVRVAGMDLEPLIGKYPSFVGSSGELERDGICLCKSHGIKYGLEIENYPDYGMPRRTLTYDASEYEKEASEMRRRHELEKDLADFAERKSGMTREECYHPVITAVLYLGQGHFKGRRTLRECFCLPEKIKPYAFERLQNYTFPVIEADYVNPEDYRTELKQFFQAMQSRYDKRRLAALFEREEFQNLSTQTQKIIAVHLNIRKLKKKVIEEEEDMCKAYRDLVKDWKEEGHREGLQKGLQKGHQEGRIQGLLFAIRNLMESSQVTAEQALDLLKITGEERAVMWENLP